MHVRIGKSNAILHAACGRSPPAAGCCGPRSRHAARRRAARLGKALGEAEVERGQNARYPPLEQLAEQEEPPHYTESPRRQIRALPSPLLLNQFDEVGVRHGGRVAQKTFTSNSLISKYDDLL